MNYPLVQVERKTHNLVIDVDTAATNKGAEEMDILLVGMNAIGTVAACVCAGAALYALKAHRSHDQDDSKDSDNK